VEVEFSFRKLRGKDGAGEKGKREGEGVFTRNGTSSFWVI